MISLPSLRWLSQLLLLAAFAAPAPADEPRSEQSIRAEFKDLGVKFQVAPRGIFGADPLPHESGLWIDENWNGSEEDLKKLRQLDGVTSVVLEGPQVTDAWMRHVAEMQNVTSIALKKSKITADGLAELKGLSKLEHLAVYYAPIDDRAAPHLAVMGQLKSLKVFGGDLTEEGRAALHSAFEGSRTVLDIRRGAFLGLGCVQHPAGCMINYVREGSAAAKGGVQPGDVLVRYNGRKVADFESLASFIAQDSPGTEVEFEILRDDEKLTKRVTLGYWE